MKELLNRLNSVNEDNYKSTEFLDDIKQFIAFIFNSVQDGISILDTDYTILEVNQVMGQWYSDSGTLINKKCYEIYHNRKNFCPECPAKKAISKKHMIKGIVPFDGKGTLKGWQELYCFPLFSEKGKVLGIIEYVRDVTRVKKTEEAIEKLEKRLMLKEKTLKEKNIALKVLLQARNYEKEIFAEDLMLHYNTSVLPVIDYLKRRLNKTDEYEVILNLEKAVVQLLSPAMKEIIKKYPDLTNRELQIIYLIIQGRSTKEIADVLCISNKAVEFHRYNIRKKFSLANVKTSLYNYLVKN